MANALFLNASYLQKNTPLNANVDMGEVYAFAKVAEDKYIQEVIGTKLYDYLKGVVIASKASPPTTISTNDQTLLEHLREALIWYTIHEAMPFIHTKVRNIGVVSQSGENMESASDLRLSKLMGLCMGNAVSYMNKVKRYLCEYDDLYTEYKCDSWNLNPNNITRDNCGISFSRPTTDYDYVKKWFNS